MPHNGCSTSLRAISEPNSRLVAILVCAVLLGSIACRRESPPNILLVTIDTARADAFGPYGSKLGSTPTIDALAREGVVFEQAMSPVPLTLPSHASLLTGTFPPRHSVRENGAHALPTEMITAAELFRDSGYRTGAFVGAYVLDARWGLDQGFDVYSGSFDASSADVFSLADLQRTADRVADDALAWLGQSSEKPFFAWAHFYDPHTPYTPPPAVGERFADPYAGEIAFTDSQLARLLKSLEERGQLRNTIVVVAADHGEGFGEHGENGHGLLLYEETLHVPLIVRAPGLAPGRRVSVPVSLVDVLPTLTELARVKAPAQVQGQSLVSLARGGDEHATPIYAETVYPRRRFGWSALRVLRDGPWKVIESSEPELYDVASDARENRDLSSARNDVLRRALHRLRETSTKLARGAASPRPSGADAESRAKLAALGYVSGASRAGGTPDAQLPSPRKKIHRFNELTRARTELALRHFGEAEAQLRELARAEPGMLEAHVALGELYLRSREPEKSSAAFRNALELTSDDPSLIAALATAELQSARPAEAVKIIDAARAAHPNEPRLHFVAGRARLALGDVANAKRELEAMLRVNDRAAAAYVELAGIAIAEDDHKRAETLALKALQIDPRARGARLFLAQALDHEGRPSEAWRQAQLELESWPDDFRPAHYLAELAARLGRNDRVEPYLRTAIRLEPRFVGSYLLLARHLLERGESLEEGVRLTRTALELGPKGRDEALAYFLLADFYSRLGRNDLSEQNAALARRALSRHE